MYDAEQDESPDVIGRLRMAQTMEERCWILTEKFGAKFMKRLYCRALLICILNELRSVGITGIQNYTDGLPARTRVRNFTNIMM